MRTLAHRLSQLGVHWTSIEMFNLSPRVVEWRRDMTDTHTCESCKDRQTNCQALVISPAIQKGYS